MTKKLPALGALRALGSVRLAICVMVALVAVLVWATLLEKWYGDAAARFAVYGAWWFTALCGLLGLNVLAALALRFPWKRHQAGFVLAHLGVLLLLVGCLVSRRAGVEATLAMFEGESSSTAYKDAQQFVELDGQEYFDLTILPPGGNSADPQAAKSPTPQIPKSLNRIPFTPGPLDWQDYRWLPAIPWRLAHRDQGVVYDRDGIRLAVLDYQRSGQREPRVRLRMEVDGRSEEFWLSAQSLDPLARSAKLPDREKQIEGQGRAVRLTLQPRQYRLGLAIRLSKAERKLDPGTQQASYYGSHLDFLPLADPARPAAEPGPPVAEDVLVTLNAPLDFADPATGRSYRLFQTGMPGPYAPDEVPGAAQRPVYASYLTLNYDPGRGLQYAGCLLAVVGIFVRYYVRPAAQRRTRRLGSASSSVVLLLAAVGVGASLYCTGGHGFCRPGGTIENSPAVNCWEDGQRSDFHRPVGTTEGVTLCSFSVVPTGLSVCSFQTTPSDESLGYFQLPLRGTAQAGGLSQFSSACLLGQAENGTVPFSVLVGALDCSTWQRLPVLDSGRIMPLDTFARNQVKKICGTPPPGLSAAELLLAWLAEPQAWETAAFLEADDEILRSRLLEVPLHDESGRRLRYVSPQQVAAAGKFHERLEQLARQQEEAQRLGWPWEPAARDKKVQELGEAYNRYRQLTYDPAQPDVDRPWFSEAVIAMARAWIATEGDLRQSPFGKRPEIAKLVARVSDSMRKLVAPLMSGGEQARQSLGTVEPLLAELDRATAELAAQAGQSPDSAGAKPPAAGPQRRSLAARLAEVARLAVRAHWALFDPPAAIRLLPGLEPSALEADRYRGQLEPWISLRALDQGPAGLVERYPPEELAAVRQAYHAMLAAYRDRQSAGGPNRCSAAIEHFAAALGQLAQSIEPARRELPLVEKDEAILAATAYPPPGSTDAEVRYNRLDPFFWGWVVMLAAVVCLVAATAPGRVGQWMFCLGMGLVVLAQLFVLAGLGLRMAITHWAPVTNMFETIVFAGLCVAVLTVWLTLFPLLRPGSRAAWQWTALPTPHPLTPSSPQPLNPSTPQPLRWLMLPLRLALMAWVVGLTGILSSARPGGGYQMMTLLPRRDLGASLPTAGAVLVWLVGLCVWAATVWYAPRVILAAVLTLPAAAIGLARRGAAARLRQAHRRNLVALVGSMVALAAALGAYYAPFPKDIKPLMAVLRNNTWLAIHVLTIMVGYGAAAKAWGLGNIALGFYLFGRYRPAEGGTSLSAAKGVVGGTFLTEGGTSLSAAKGVSSKPATPFIPQGRAAQTDQPILTRPLRPPQVCTTLARLNYQLIRIAVLLLAIGTILGGMWADVSWGRFWGWDPKEVGALVSLLVYLVVLHGRHVGYRGDLSMAAGSVLGFTAILLTWFVVNFWMGGKHSYGEGGAEQWVVAGCLTAVTVNLLFLALAALRAWLQSRRTTAGA
ncbi:MAG: cytochrome c biogenesis protein CcsA [Thermoguttaceae bacterium]